MTATVNTDKRVKTKYKVSEHSKNTEITQDEGEKKKSKHRAGFSFKTYTGLDPKPR